MWLCSNGALTFRLGLRSGSSVMHVIGADAFAQSVNTRY
jgi:hypothetical protein